jgi:hypothetical protein
MRIVGAVFEKNLIYYLASLDSYGLKKQLSSRYLGRQTKHVPYKAHVRSILTYKVKAGFSQG